MYEEREEFFMQRRLFMLGLCVIVLIMSAGCGIENTTWELETGSDCPEEFEINKQDDDEKYEVTVREKGQVIDGTLEEVKGDQYRFEYTPFIKTYIYDVAIDGDSLIMKPKQEDRESCILKRKEDEE